MVAENILSVNLSNFTKGNPTEQARFVDAIGYAYEETGFIAVENHEVPTDLIAKFNDRFSAFFNLPDHIKSKYEIQGIGGQRGYTSKGKEKAKGNDAGDLKEFFHVGQPNPRAGSQRNEFPRNIYVEEIPDLLEVSLEIYQILESTGAAILRAISKYLELEETYFDDKINGGNSVLRAINYYSLDDEDLNSNNAIRAAAHEDINLITIMLGDHKEGLEILNSEKKWVPVTASPDQLIVNVGDMMQRLTNNRLRSTTHRVVNQSSVEMNQSQLAVSFFLHPVPEMDLSCLPNCINEKHKKVYKDITAGDFLNERLKEIGLKA